MWIIFLNVSLLTCVSSFGDATRTTEFDPVFLNFFFLTRSSPHALPPLLAYLPFAIWSKVVHFLDIHQLHHIARQWHPDMPCGRRSRVGTVVYIKSIPITKSNVINHSHRSSKLNLISSLNDVYLCICHDEVFRSFTTYQYCKKTHHYK